jgi:hypothetical protein
VPTFCRHNRFVADCPICSKGTVLDRDQSASRRKPASSSGARHATRQAAGAARTSRGPFVSAGPYDGVEVRLERVPGGLRMAAWRGGQIERVAPELPAADVPALLAEAAAQDLLVLDIAAGRPPERPPAPGAVGASSGRTGELRDELRVEHTDGGKVRVARWIMRPNRGWELQQAPVMLPAQRFAEALRGAFASGGPGD